MTPLFKKLQFKNQESIYVINAPESFANEQIAMEPIADVRNVLGDGSIAFALAFAYQKTDIDRLAPELAKRLEKGGILYIAYPKKSSKQYKSDIHRDTGWDAFGKLNFEPVRLIAIDADWSAMRLKPVSEIKTLKRNKKMILSKEGMKKRNFND